VRRSIVNAIPVLTSLLVVSLGSAVPTRGSAQTLPFDTVPSAPVTAALPLAFEPIAQPPASPAADDAGALAQKAREALQLARERLRAGDLSDVQKQLDAALNNVDWDAINKQIEKGFEARAPQMTWLTQDLEKQQQQLKGEMKTLQKKLQDTDAFKDIFKNRELSQRQFDGFVRVAPRGYSAVLVLGDMQGGASIAENVPEAAKKALADMKDFLPYKNYRLLDSAWVLGSGSSVTRLRGADDQVYQLSLNPSGYPLVIGKLGGLHVRLQELEEGSASRNPAREVEENSRRLAELQAKLKAALDQYGPNHPDVVKIRASIQQTQSDIDAAGAKANQAAEQRAAASRSSVAEMPRSSVVDTSFNMAVGETVVVGTSRLRGDKALILLLTAVPQTGAASDGSNSKSSSSSSSSNSSSNSKPKKF